MRNGDGVEVEMEEQSNVVLLVKDGGSNCQRWRLQLSKMEASNMEASNCQ